MTIKILGKNVQNFSCYDEAVVGPRAIFWLSSGKIDLYPSTQTILSDGRSRTTRLLSDIFFVRSPKVTLKNNSVSRVCAVIIKSVINRLISLISPEVNLEVYKNHQKVDFFFFVQLRFH